MSSSVLFLEDAYGLRLLPHQLELLKAMDKRPDVSVVYTGHQTGKTVAMMHYLDEVNKVLEAEYDHASKYRPVFDYELTQTEYHEEIDMRTGFMRASVALGAIGGAFAASMKHLGSVMSLAAAAEQRKAALREHYVGAPFGRAKMTPGIHRRMARKTAAKKRARRLGHG